MMQKVTLLAPLLNSAGVVSCAAYDHFPNESTQGCNNILEQSPWDPLSRAEIFTTLHLQTDNIKNNAYIFCCVDIPLTILVISPGDENN